MPDQNTSSSTESRGQQPAVRGFQLDSTALGDLAKSVNLFRGDVNVPLSLVSLSGPEGLGVSLSGFYGSHVGQQVETWNLTAPTGVLGLGWSLPFDMIQLATAGTATWFSGRIVLYVGGMPSDLVPIRREGAAIGAGETLVFASREHPLWSISYQPAEELWTVVREDGITARFGGAASGRDTVQHGVRWNNWAGSSVVPTADQARFAVAWNLASLEDRWGARVLYSYRLDEQPVGNGLAYTRASYLLSVTDVYGRRIALSYREKEPAEVQPAHVVPPGAPGAAYQDRYETLYLDRLDVLPPVGEDPYYSVQFGYALAALPAAGGGAPVTKRYLTSVTQLHGGEKALPSLRFEYDLDPSSAARGRLLRALYPEGGEVEWSYRQVVLNPEDKPLFRATFEARRPADPIYVDAVPRLWFGADYTVVTWISTRAHTLRIEVYSYGGRWCSPWVLEDVPAATDPDQVFFAAGRDFFALYFHTTGTTVKDTVRLFRKQRYRFGRWEVSEHEVPLTGGPVVPEETSLVAGEDFVALHVGGTTQVRTFRYEARGGGWTVFAFSRGRRIALAAAENWLLASFYDDATRTARDQLWWIDPFGEGSAAWRSGSLGGASRKFTWSSSYVNGYWGLGEGFGVGTYMPDGESQTRLRILQWSRDFTSVDQVERAGGAFPTLVAGSTIACTARLYRFDGATWTEQIFGSSAADDLYAAAPDTVLRSRRSGSTLVSTLARYDAFAARPPDWAFEGFPPRSARAEDVELETAAAEQATQFAGPAIAGEFLTLETSLYYRGAESQWDLAGELPGALERTIINRGPVYVAWEDAPVNPAATTTSVALLHDGGIDHVVRFPGQRIHGDSKAPGTRLAGPRIFATYPAERAFATTDRFTLHRILNHSTADLVEDTAVGSVVLDVRPERRRTRYDYDALAAVFDASGQVVQYPHAFSERVSDDGSISYGKTKNFYFNGLDAETAAALGLDRALVPEGSPEGGPEAYYSRLNGLLAASRDLDGRGDLVARVTNSWTAIRLTPVADGGFALLPRSVVIELARQETVTAGLERVVLGSDGAEPPPGTAELALVEILTYDPATGFLRTRTLENTGSSGAAQQRTLDQLYAFEVPEYAAMRQERLLRALAQRTLQVDGRAVQSSATTWRRDWSEAAAWGEHQLYGWRAGEEIHGRPPFDFAPGSDRPAWVLQTEDQDYNAAGLVLRSVDVEGSPATALYDRSGRWQVALFGNADVQAGEASYTGFQPYEGDLGWRAGDGPIERLYYPGDSHTGVRCLRLPPGEPGAGPVNAFRGASGRRCLFACWVKTPSGEGAVDARWELSFGDGAASSTLPIPESPGWTYLFRYLDLPAEPAPVTVTCRAINASAGRDVLLDELRFQPVETLFSGTVYAPDSFLVEARLGVNGETTRTFYDHFQRPVGTVGPDDRVAGVSASGFSRHNPVDAYDPLAPNDRLELRARTGGAWDDFRTADWQRRWSTGDPPSAWEVIERQLMHRGAGRGEVTLRESADLRHAAAAVAVTAVDRAEPTGALGISVGGVAVEWAPAEREWRMSVAGAVVASRGGTAVPPMRWLLLTTGRSAVFFLDDRSILTWVAAPGADPLSGPLVLTATDPGIAFSQVLVPTDPVATLDWSNGGGETIQRQRLGDGEVLAAQVLYDPLGRAAVRTKWARYERTAAGYRTALVEGFDWTSGILSGEVARYYSGQDGRSDDQGYPYSRRRYEDSAFGRLLEEGRPGRELAIRPGNLHTARYRYGVNAAGGVFDHLPAEAYLVVLAIDADGLTTAAVRDRLGTPVARMWGPEGLPRSTSQASAVLRDVLDYPSETRPPNYYRPPTGGAADWVAVSRYDAFGRKLLERSPDTGQTDLVYDAAGRVRFVLTANGRHSGGSETDRILYVDYDLLGRVVEQGWFEGRWDRDELDRQADRHYPVDPPDWRFRYVWDGDDAELHALGRITLALTRRGEGRDPVEERSAYDLAGNTVRRETRTGADDPGPVLYAWNHLGLVEEIRYPPSLTGGAPLTVRYGYSPLGQVATVGRTEAGQEAYYARYAWTADGRLEGETLGEGTGSSLSRAYTYWSPGWLRAIEGDHFSERLHYDGTPGYGGERRWSGLVTSAEVTQPVEGGGTSSYRWRYAYDPFGRLRTAENSLGADYSLGVEEPVDYDGNSNLLRLSAGKRRETYDYEAGADRLHAATAAGPGSYAWSPGGEATRTPTLALDYDPTSGLVLRVARRDGPRSLELIYGSGRQRLEKKVREGETVLSRRRYVTGADDRPLVEVVREGERPVLGLSYVYGPRGLLALDGADGAAFVLADHLGSSRVLVGAGGAVLGRYDYLPYGGDLGAPGGADPQRLIYRYTGLEWDPEVALYDDQARLYDPAVRVFHSPDPARQYFSPYVYVGGDPIDLIDPTGKSSNLLGVIVSSIEIGIGALLLPTGLGTGVGLVLVTDGATGLAYSEKAGDDFDTGNFFALEGATTISVLEIQAGIMVDILSEGVLASTVGGGLLGAGISGLANSIQQIATNDPGEFSLGEWGIEMGIGAATGALTAGLVGAGGKVLTAALRPLEASTSTAARATAVGLRGVGSAAISSGAGALSSAIGSVARQAAAGRGIDWSKVGTAAWQGAAIGAVAGTTSGLVRSASVLRATPTMKSFREVLSEGWIGKNSPETGWMQLIGPPLGGTYSTITRSTAS